MQSLNIEEINQVSGGHFIIKLLEAPHIIMGLKEFINYAISCSVHGCSNIDEGDYLTKGVCRLIGYPNE